MNKFTKPIYVTKAFLPPIEEYTKKIESIWENNWITNNGPIHNEFEKKIEKYLNAENINLFVNGHLALDIAIKAMELKGEVITTPFTFASTTHAIVSNNLTPVFCDIKLDDFTIDENKIEELITERTSAIMPVHVFGYPCNVDKINKIAQKHDLKVIYDAAHVFGVEVDGVGIGNFGDISMFSLHATKVYNSIEGGLLTFKDNKLKRKLNLYKNFGISGEESIELAGLNAKMNEFQATMGLLNLKYVDEQINNRKKIASIYRKELKEIKGIYYLEDKEGVKHNYSYFPIIIEDEHLGINRDEIYEILKRYNVFTRKYFYPLVTDFQCYRGKYKCSHLINAKYIANKVLTLPIYGQLSEDDAVRIIKILKYIIENKDCVKEVAITKDE
ncbi:DegT/DnrJ/EryC1/StrS family aminotransferase [Terrisporobacter petrolearius]|uniref:DegT/DnrJ/EryC1/StrS family aminotransferase n=1 Tax=Terrisporobacter petrolearius TaxID=1460447 RepID=UPI0031CC9E70